MRQGVSEEDEGKVTTKPYTDSGLYPTGGRQI